MGYYAIPLILASLLCLTTVSAQQAEVTRLSFTVYGLGPGDYSNIHYQDAHGEPIKLDFHRKRRSDAYQAEILTETPVLKFLRKTTGEDKGEKSDYMEISTVQLPKVSGRLLFVFVPENNPGTKEPFRILPVDDAPSAGPSASVRIINLTGSTLLGMVDSERFELPSLACSEPFQTVSGRQSDFSIVAEGSSRYHLVYRNSFRIDSGSRAILFLTPPYRKVSLKLGGQLLFEDLASDGE